MPSFRSLVISAVLLVCGVANAAVYTVNTAVDPGDGICDAAECTLREAISTANANPGADVVQFAIGGTPPFTIAPTTNLPAIVDDLFIDGFSQPGTSPNTSTGSDNAVLAIQIDGQGVRTICFEVRGGSVDIRGLAIGNFTADAIVTYTAANVVRGCRLGTDLAGAAARGNYGGVAIYGTTNNRIGGSSPADRNIISANARNGIDLIATGLGPKVPDVHFPNYNTIEGNFIGVDASGSAALGNAFSGVSIALGSFNVIRNNVISGNGRDAIEIIGSMTCCPPVPLPADGNLIVGNRIGANSSGMAALPNAVGVEIDGRASGNIIGGSSAADRNIISGNQSNAIRLQTTQFGEVAGTQIDGNFIGSDATGNAALGNGVGITILGGGSNQIGTNAGNVIVANGGDAIFLAVSGAVTARENTIRHNLIGRGSSGAALGNAAAGVHIDAGANDGNTIGGSTADANTIENNGSGVAIVGGHGNAILSNSIAANAGLGIDLNLDGVTANDPLDADDGPNALQNFPVLTQATPINGGVSVSGELDSTPSTSFTIQIFSVPSPSELLASFVVTTNASGVATFTAPVALSAATSIAATATNNATLDTSEFSAPLAINQAAGIPTLSSLMLFALAGALALLALLRISRA